MVCETYRQGADADAIAKKHSIHRNTVYAVLERRGVPLRRKRRSYLSMDEMASVKGLYEDGLSFQAIAEKTGLSYRTVEKYCKRAGVVARPSGFRRGEEHHAWTGGRRVAEDGYVLIWLPKDDPFVSMAQEHGGAGGGYVLEHRLVMARKLGRLLTEDETVHHKDTNRQNNDEDNLVLHHGNHGKGGVFVCLDCGSHNISADVD